jgi:hypothetical protein
VCAAMNICLTLTNALSATLEENAALFTAVWWWGCKTASHRSKPPLLNIGFNKDKAHLAEIDLDVARAVGSDCREEVLRLETMCDIFQLFPVASEEDGSGTRSVAYSDNVSLLV